MLEPFLDYQKNTGWTRPFYFLFQFYIRLILLLNIKIPLQIIQSKGVKTFISHSRGAVYEMAERTPGVFQAG